MELMTLEQLGNRINALGAEGQKLTVADFKAILGGFKDVHGDLATKYQTLEPRMKALADLEASMQKMMEFTATLKATAGAKELTKEEKAGRAMGAWYRLNRGISQNRENDFKRMIDHGMKQLTQQGKDDWAEGGKWNVGQAPVDAQGKVLGTPLRGDAVTGSVLVPQDFSSEVFRIASDASELLGQMRTIPMTNRKISMNRLLTNLGWTWVTNEATAKTESAPTFEGFDLECETAATWLAITEELMEDSEVALVQFFAQLYGETLGVEVDKQGMYANAAPFTGVLHETGTVAVAMPAGKTSLLNLHWTDLNRMKTAIPKAARVNAKFFMSSDVFTVIENQKDGNDRPIFSEVRDTIAGRPYSLIDGMPDTGDDAAGLPFIAYGDPKNIMHGDRVGMEVKLFDQTVDAMQYDRLYLRARVRKAIKVALPAAFAVLSTAAA